MKVPETLKFWVVFLFSVDLVEVRAGDKKCKNPKGMDGDSYIEGCIKNTCKSGTWRPSLEPSFCCWNGEAHPHGSTITSVSNGCSTAVLYCRDGRDKAEISLEVENNCGKYSTAKQVSELKSMLEDYLENTDCHSTSTPTSEMPTRKESKKGILVSGGWGAQTSVEIFIPETGESCGLPDLPDNRNGHTMDIVYDSGKDKILVCGGGAGKSQTSCISIDGSSNSWGHFRDIQRRDGHISWYSGHTSDYSKSMLLLMGGEHGRSSTEAVVDPFDSYSGFSLTQDTRYACSITKDEFVILTGGRDTMKSVTIYDNDEGHYVQILPDMNEGRRYHACGSYHVDGTSVLLVAGGRGGDYSNIIASTEKLPKGASVWITVEPLPRAMIAMASVSLHNKVFITGGGRGGRDDEYSRRSEILAFDGNNWEEVGDLQFARNFHATTVIDMSDFQGICPLG